MFLGAYALLLHAAAVLLGAPATTQIQDTFLFALLTASLSFRPLGSLSHWRITHAADTIFRMQTEVHPSVPSHPHAKDDAAGSVHDKPGGLPGVKEFLVRGGIIAQAVLLFAWGSAIVVPLDWDRPWQKWPVPGIMGACVGAAVGHALHTAATMAWGKRFPKPDPRTD